MLTDNYIFNKTVNRFKIAQILKMKIKCMNRIEITHLYNYFSPNYW